MNAHTCRTCGQRVTVRRTTRIVREAAALILLRTGYSREQILEHSSISVAPLDEKALTGDLVEAAATYLRAVGFTYSGVWETVARLRTKLGVPKPEPPVAAPVEQLLLDGSQP
ncbi:hypothetical protein ABH931_006114 [Streptacidiphilus sp. MAP12-33]|uniref:hypothetical protein n=1 Tax=Streptacidiphilus sp. MAP12-33 TaxID=3156266 RepID=UPI003515EE50